MTSRLIISLAIGIIAVTFASAFYEVRAQKRALQHDLTNRAAVLAESIEEAIEPVLEHPTQRGLERFVERFGNRQVLEGVAIYGLQGQLLAATATLGSQITTCPPPAIEAMATDAGSGAFVTLGGRPFHVYAVPLHRDQKVAGALAVFHDPRYIEQRTLKIWQDILLRVLIQMILVAIIILLIVRWSIQGPIARMAKWMKALRAGETAPLPEAPEGLLKPIAREVTQLTTSLAEARLAAEQEAWLRESAESLWTPERLRARVRSKLPEGTLFVVSNREPYMHVHQENGVGVVVPASGLVTAMEPVLLACGGTWIAHGSGDADQENSDPQGRLRVPPDKPEYTLRRVWLSREEQAGYYYGFANEGLWPLCHIAFTRPVFRASDWDYYQQANRKFADAVLEEIDGTPDPLVLVQDYHFALLPRLVKQARPDARVSVFWHIPWPNPQVFGICPWERELLDGLLGADCVGFHIQSHCNYFLETVDDALEARVDREHFAVHRHGHRTVVRPFPISVSLADDAEAKKRRSPYLERAGLFKRLGVEGVYLGVGVDRVDYTKGLIERFRGIERFLERFPRYCGQFTFVQIGAPSRTEIERYASFLAEVDAESERINARFQSGRWKPIVFLKRHHTHREIAEYYRAADLCLVTSLHDGMNLVAKEFVATRSDDQGVLILSRFTGAARQLPDALIVNPYDTEEVAKAIWLALEMDPEERSARMRRMRQSVRDHNIYRWAASLLGTLSEIRLDEQPPVMRRRATAEPALIPAPEYKLGPRAVAKT
ncbi:MAG TPA: trehalose-6-phosphate synthase [Terriglobia bacterium]|nr:trehalose-6-phosphate synthase [Terriglobia bacterium]